MSPGSAQNLDIANELGPKPFRLDLQVVGSLKVQPEAESIPEEAPEAQGRVGADAAVSVDYLVDAPCRHTDALMGLALYGSRAR